MKTFITRVDEKFSNHDVAIQNLEKKVGQIATSLIERPQDTSASGSNKIVYEIANIISLRSGN